MRLLRNQIGFVVSCGLLLTYEVALAQPLVSVGTGVAIPGETAIVDFELQKNGVNVVTVAPLQVTFDPAVLRFESCESLVPGKSATAAVPQVGLLSVAVVGDLAVFPDGRFLQCTFLVEAAAPGRDSPITFVKADLSDDQFEDHAASGTSGALRVLRLTPTPGPSVCVGDCDGSGTVTVDELVTMISVALGSSSRERCIAGDATGGSEITIDEMTTAVRMALLGCPRSDPSSERQVRRML